MSLRLRVLTLNCWGIPFPYPVGSKDRRHRIDAIVERLTKGEFDVIALEEIWFPPDYKFICDALRRVYPHSHYFYSGLLGSGICILSKTGFTDVSMHRFSLNGYPHHIHRGDWHGGKVVGMVRLVVHGGIKLAVYATHTHAEYTPKADAYLPHRVVQAYELSQFVKLTSPGSDLVIVMGDFNLQPCNLGYKLILANAGLKDAWMERKSGSECETCDGITHFAADNCYTTPPLFDMRRRIDYITWRNSSDLKVTVDSCHTDFHKIPGEDKNYSDHEAVVATFSIEKSGSNGFSSPLVVKGSPDLPGLLQDAIDAVNDGQHKIWANRLFYIGAFLLCALIYFVSVGLEITYPSLALIIMLSRFGVTLLVGFLPLYGIVFLSIEWKGLQAAKESMKVLLKSQIRALTLDQRLGE